MAQDVEENTNAMFKCNTQTSAFTLAAITLLAYCRGAMNNKEVVSLGVDVVY